MKHGDDDGAGIDRKLHNPIEDRLIPLEPLDLSSIRSIDDLVRAMSKTAFTGRQVGEAADVLETMARDKDCFVVMTLAGAMTVAKQGLIVAELIDRGIVNAIVSTGALMAHGLVEATGRSHFRYNPEVSDTELYEQGYNRVYDTLEPEQNLDNVERVMSAVLEDWDHSEVMCSYKLNHAIGAHLLMKMASRSLCPPSPIPSLAWTWPCTIGCARVREGTRFASIHSKTWSISPQRSFGRPGWEFLRLVAEFRGTGRNSLGRSSNCAIAAWARTFP